MSSGSDSDSSNGCSARLKASIDPKFNYTQDGKKKEVNKVTTEPLKSLRYGWFARYSSVMWTVSYVFSRSVEDVQPEEVRLNLTKSQQTYVGNLLAGRLDRSEHF